MGGFQFQVKLIAALMIAALFFLNDAPEAYAQIPYGSEKASPTSSGSRVGWRKMDNNGGTEGSDGGMSLGNVEEGFRFRSLRSERRVPSPPPAPARNPAKSTVKPPVFGFRPRSPPPPPPPPPCIH